MLVEKAKEKTNIDILKVKVKEIVGNGSVTAVRLVDSTGKENKLKVDGIFILVGSLAMTNIVRKAGVFLDERGCIKVDRRQATNVEGVFAAGDCTCGGMQIITAAGEGATAAVQAYRHVRNDKN
jgi:thioredoxin reductase